jgi:MFS family permease
MRPTARPSSPDRPPEPERLALYAWITLGASFLTTALVFGVWFSFAVFFATMVEEFQWSRGGAAVAFSVGNLVQAALSPLIGLLTDRWGPRQIVVWGCVISAVSLAACSTVQALWHLTVFFGIGVGLGVGLAGPVSHSALLAAWFVRRRGTIIGLAFAGMGVGVKILGPLAQYLILHIGWRHTFLALAVFTLVYGLLMALTLRNSPQDVGLQPYGGSTLPSTVGTPGGCGGGAAGLDGATGHTHA